jgi:predicted metal-dependent phosphoesterase TrpH
VRLAASQGLSAIALTDHDTVGGLAEAADEAARAGIRFIRGVELEIEWDFAPEGGDAPPQKRPSEFHLLGLGLKSPSRGFLELTAELQRERERRNLLIVERMREAGIAADYGELALFARGCVGRPHFAQYLVRLGAASSVQQAFERFLGNGKPFYIRKAGANFDRAAAAIHESGGIAAVAHPLTFNVSMNRLRQLLAVLKERGLDGIEAWHPVATRAACRYFAYLARKLGLRVTAGSDFHGEKRPGRRLGHTAGGKPIDDSFLDALL